MHVISHRVLLFKFFGIHTATTDDSGCILMIKTHMFFHHIITKLKHQTSIFFPLPVKKKKKDDLCHRFHSKTNRTPPSSPTIDQTLYK